MQLQELHDRPALSDDSDDNALLRSSTLFGVENGPTRWGNVSFSIGPQVDNVVEFRVAVNFQMPMGAVEHPPTLQVRIRDPTGTKKLLSAATVPPAGAEDVDVGCTVVAVLSDRELVTIAPPPSTPAAEAAEVDGATRGKLECTVRATFGS